MPLTVIDSSVTKTSISITFSDPVVTDRADPHGGLNTANYTIVAANSVDFAEPTTIKDSDATITAATLSSNNTRVTFTFKPSTGANNEFQAGDSVSIVIRDVEGQTAGSLNNGFAMISQVAGPVRRVTRDVEDAISYPILTEEIGYRPSPVGTPTGGAVTTPAAGGMNLGQVAAKTVTDVLGWKVNPADPKGFVGALTQSFTLNDVEGHIEATWTPRTYAVQNDLGGGITGAQASLYMRAKDALDTSLPMLDGLYPLDPEADPEYVKALREMARSQMSEIIKELGVVGLPSILRIDTYFEILLGQNPAKLGSTQPQFNPDLITGTLGTLRDTYGIYFEGNPFNNSIEDEQDITNFRVISDYMTSLMQSWIANRPFFVVDPTRQAFFGTQLVLISRQFNVIAETVNEVRFALDSVFIGPNERQTLLLEFADPNLLPSMFLEDVLDEVENFATSEGPRLLKDGGKISVTNNILPVVNSLRNLINQAHEPANINDLPDGFKTARVRNSLDDLQDQLDALINLTEQVEQQVPPPEGKPIINSVSVEQDSTGSATAIVVGDQFDSAIAADIRSSAASTLVTNVTFYSSQRIDVIFDPSGLSIGNHDVVVTNPNGQSSTFEDAFTWDGAQVRAGLGRKEVRARAKLPAARGAGTSSARRRTVSLSVQGQPVPPQRPMAKPPASSAPDSTTPAPAPAATTTSSVVDKQLASLQEKHDNLEKGLEGIQSSHDALSQKLDEVQKNNQEALANKFAEAQKNHETLMEEVKGLAGKIATLFEGKKSKTKDE